MRIVHTSDYHFGIKKYKFRNDRLIDSLDKILEHCIKEEVDIVVAAGDIFNARRSDSYDSNLLFEELIKFNDANIKFMLLPGNHDIPLMGIERDYPINYIRPLQKKNKLDNLYLSFDNELIGTFDNIDIIHLLYNDVNNYESFLKKLKSPRKKIIISHAYIKNAVLTKKRFFKDGTDIDYFLKIFADHNVIGFLNGHIHTPQILYDDQKTLISYSGSLVQCNFGECGIDTGFYQYEIDDSYSYIRHKFISLDNKMFFSIKYKEGMIEYLKQAINSKLIKPKSVIKIYYNESMKDKVNFNVIKNEMIKHEIIVVPSIYYQQEELQGNVEKIYKEMSGGEIDSSDGVGIINHQVKLMCGSNNKLYEYYLEQIKHIELN